MLITQILYLLVTLSHLHSVSARLNEHVNAERILDDGPSSTSSQESSELNFDRSNEHANTERTLDDLSFLSSSEEEDYELNFDRSQEILDLHQTTASSQGRQAKVWNMISTFDSYKSSVCYTTGSGRGSKPTLTSFKYLVLPVWWSDANTNDPALRVDSNHINDIFNQNKQYYTDMSWERMSSSVTWKILPQTKININSASPGFSDTEREARAIVNKMGYVKDVDYNGIAMIYFNKSIQNGPFKNGTNYGGVNRDFMWMSYKFSLSVTRHEVGHNFGHPHHVSNSYTYRQTRPDRGEGKAPYDGFDMMSGGNGYDISHFAAASKWFFNWIPDESIILMQPEGSTSECPSCSKSGTFTLRPFDDKSLLPTPTRKMGIHIPITVSRNRLYSYWLSYRSGNKGEAAKGLSVHLTWFDLQINTYFGAKYDSMNYDAFGNTDSTADSFVLENTCYHISPAAYLKDRHFVDAKAVQPVACVNSINEGSSITVTVTFLDAKNPPKPKVEANLFDLKCGKSSRLDASFSPSSFNLVRVHNTGDDGLVTINSCTSGGRASAFIYDSFPHSAITYGSQPAYGSFSGSGSNAGNSCKSFSYESDFGQTYILLPPTNGQQTTIDITCKLTKCLPNQYLSGNNCAQCPNNGRSDAGSTSVQNCEECPAGTVLPHPLSKECALSETYTEITSSTAWRILSADIHTEKSWGWDVIKLEFFDNIQCSGSPVDTSRGTPIDSGNAGSSWGPGNAFDNSGNRIWGGRKDSNDLFWLGMEFNSRMQVRCIKVHQSTTVYSNEVRIQAKDDQGKWQNAWIEKLQVPTETDNVSTIPLDYDGKRTSPPTRAPVPTPTPPPPTGGSGFSRKFMLINPQTGKALDVDGAKCDDGTNIHLWKVNNSGAQIFHYHFDSDAIVNVKCNKAITTKNSCGQNDNIVLWRRHGGSNQQWLFFTDDTVRSVGCNGNLISIYNAEAKTGANIVSYRNINAWNQKWRIEYVSTPPTPTPAPIPTPTPPAPTPTPEDFEFFPFMDSTGNDIGQSNGRGIEAFAKECLANPKCRGFNSNGWMKHSLRPQSQWNKWTEDPTKGLYVRKSGAPTPTPPPVPVPTPPTSGGKKCNSINPNERILPARFGRTNHCYRIQVRNRGRLLVDTKDPGCAKFFAGNRFRGVSVSNYQRTTTDGIAMYQGRWTGSIELLEDPSLIGAKFEVSGNSRTKTFSGKLTVPSCSNN